MNKMLASFNWGHLKPSNKFHYAWVIVFIASAMRLIGTAIRISFSILVPHMVNVFGWSYGAVGFAFSLQWIMSGVFGPMAGWFGDRYGIRRTMMAGIFLFVGSMVLTGFVTQLWQFYLVFGILLSGSMSVFQVPVVPAVAIWFKKHLGVSMGILESSQGLGPLILVPLIPPILDHLGWSWAFWLPGLVGGAILLLLIQFYHNEPADIGLRPWGASKDEPIQSLQTGHIAAIRTRIFLQQVRHTGTFWNLIGIHFWGCAGHAVILVFLVTMGVERGIPLASAGLALTLLHVTSSITRFAVPVVSDRLGSKGAMATCFLMQVAPILLLTIADETWMFYLFGILFGIGFGGEMSAFAIINRQYYGDAPIGTAYGWETFGAGLGMAAGALGAGILQDLTGNYNYMLVYSMIMSMIGVVSILILPSTATRQIPHWEDKLPIEARSKPSVNIPQP